MYLKKIIGGACLALAMATPGFAATFNFSYTFNSGDVVAGALIGEIDSGDSNIVNVTGIEDFVTLNGVSTGQSLNYLNSVSDQSYQTGETAAVSFDGSLLNLWACDTSACNTIMLFNINVPSTFVQAGFLGGVLPTNIDNPMNNSWTLEAVAAVPLPATLPLLAAGLGVFGFASRRRKKLAS